MAELYLILEKQDDMLAGAGAAFKTATNFRSEPLMSAMTRKAACAVLGVSENSDHATVRNAWRALVREHHPDLLTGACKTAHKQLSEINAAFDVINAQENTPKPLIDRAANEMRRKAAFAKRRRDQARAQASVKRDDNKARSTQPKTDQNGTHASSPSQRAARVSSPKPQLSNVGTAFVAARRAFSSSEIMSHHARYA